MSGVVAADIELQRDALARVVNALWALACDGGVVDSEAIQQAMVLAGLVEGREATEADCDSADYLEPGDIWYSLTPFGRAALERHG